MNILFDEKDWEPITKYLQEWDKWRREGHLDDNLETLDYTGPEIYSIPLIIALLKNLESTEKLNKNLINLTVILTILTAVIAIPIIEGIFGFK
jgi:hypothetical protein